MTTAVADAGIFASERPRLVGIAYRVIGLMADAEDVVQEAWVRFDRVGPENLDQPAAWLTTVTTRLSIDRLRARRRRREQYVGPWLPEPILVTESSAGDPEASAIRRASLTIGFLTLMETLGPIERAVFVLADVFATPFAEIAEILGRNEASCRQTATRARRKVRERPLDRKPDPAERRVVDALLGAFAAGDVPAAMALLAPGIVLLTDGGAARHAARRPVIGPDRVSRLVTNITKRDYSGPDAGFSMPDVNGQPALLLTLGGDVDMIIVFEVDGGLVTKIHGVRAPEKLGQMGAPTPIV